MPARKLSCAHFPSGSPRRKELPLPCRRPTVASQGTEEKAPMGFDGRTTAEQVVAGLELAGRTILITGTSAGIGRAAAGVLAIAGATIVAVARDGAKNEAAMAEIRAMHPAAALHPVTLDLADPAAIRRTADALLAAHP